MAMVGSASERTWEVGVLARGALRGGGLCAQDYIDRDRRATIKWKCDYDWDKANSSSTATEIRLGSGYWVG